MYIPKIYDEKDKKKITGIIKDNPFGILVAVENGIPVASHLLFELVERGSDLFLYSHLAKANQMQALLKLDLTFLAIFQGASSYITPSWYEKINVPTWNYISVHCYGKAKIIDNHDEEYQLLNRLVKRFEKKYDYKYKLEDLPDDYVKDEMKGLTSFIIKIDKIEAAFKLSQNRNEKDLNNIISHLEKSDDDNEKQVAKGMREQRGLSEIS
jgi:transcriptional regulator